MQPPINRAGCVLLVTLIVVAPLARSADFEITPLIGYRAGGSFRDSATQETRNIVEDASFGIALDLGRSADTQWELTFSRQDSHIEPLGGPPAGAPLDLRIDSLHLGGTFFYADADRQRYQPYVVGGLGITRFTPARAGLENRTEPSLNVGLGLRVPVSKRLALRIEGRGYATVLDTSGSVFCQSDSALTACRIRARARVLWQIEALVGLALRL